MLSADGTRILGGPRRPLTSLRKCRASLANPPRGDSDQRSESPAHCACGASIVVGRFAVRIDIQAFALLLVGDAQADEQVGDLYAINATTPVQTTVMQTALAWIQNCAAMPG